MVNNGDDGANPETSHPEATKKVTDYFDAVYGLKPKS
jgi:hypothetical protein